MLKRARTEQELADIIARLASVDIDNDSIPDSDPDIQRLPLSQKERVSQEVLRKRRKARAAKADSEKARAEAEEARKRVDQERVLTEGNDEDAGYRT